MIHVYVGQNDGHRELRGGERGLSQVGRALGELESDFAGWVGSRVGTPAGGHDGTGGERMTWPRPREVVPSRD